eukprot:3554816-Lingulodinium_polyedra.AAC.1
MPNVGKRSSPTTGCDRRMGGPGLPKSQHHPRTQESEAVRACLTRNRRRSRRDRSPRPHAWPTP